MIADLKPYAEYKDSGLPWLKHVPSAWRVVRNGSLFGQRNETGYGELPILEVSLKTGVRVRDFENSTRKQVMSDLAKYKRAVKGDVAYNMMRMWQGAVGVSPVDGLVSPAYVVARPYSHVESRFFVELFRTGEYMSEVDNYSRGIVKDRNRLYWDQFKQIFSPCPPTAEQAAIVRFLDWANGRLERAIRAKRKVIALLNEQKQAIVHRAVTRGLDPTVRFKPSRVEWLGDVPEHWEVSRAGTVCEFISAKAHEQFVEPDGEHICVTARFVSTDGRSYRRCTKNLSPASRGDVLMVMSDLPRGRALARAYLINDARSYAVNQRVCILRPVRVNPQFLALAANRHPELLAHDDGFNQTHLPNGAFKIMYLPLPPLDEQEAISDLVVRQTTALDARAHRAEREIDLLREYRTRLVVDVVTGKLDVREAAAQVPDEAPPDAAGDAADLSADPEAADEEAVA
jgi:type I restriction enzyme, S subunit